MTHAEDLDTEVQLCAICGGIMVLVLRSIEEEDGLDLLKLGQAT